MSEQEKTVKLRALVKMGEEEKEMELTVKSGVEQTFLPPGAAYSMSCKGHDVVEFVKGFEEKVEDWFTYHPPRDDEQLEKYRALRTAGKQLALIIAKEVPACADRDVAIVKVREAIMFANAAIACSTK